MPDIQLVMTDRGAANARILAKEGKVDFRRVEGASLKVRTHLTSAEAKRLFVRLFQTLQINAHFMSVIARSRLEHQEIEALEAALRADIDTVKHKLGEALDEVEGLFKANGISALATYDTQPLEIEIGILSSSGRRYLEVFNLFDQLMPLLQTLEIHEVISTQVLDRQRMALKRQIKNVAMTARRFATGLRRRMNALDIERSGQPVGNAGGDPRGGVALAESAPHVQTVPTNAEEGGVVTPDLAAAGSPRSAE